MAKLLKDILKELNEPTLEPQSTFNDSYTATEIFYPEPRTVSQGEETKYNFFAPNSDIKKLGALMRYAGHLTENLNHYEVSTKSTSTVTSYKRGDSLSPQTKDQEKFAEEGQLLLKGEFFTKEQLREFLDKTGGDRNKSGNDLLLNKIDQNGLNVGNADTTYTSTTTNPIVNTVVEKLKHDNFYSPTEGTPYISSHGDNAGHLSKGLFRLNKEIEYGKSSNDKIYITVDDLRQMAEQLMMKSQSASKVADNIPLKFGSGGYDELSDQSAAIPDPTQMGLKISVQNTRIAATKAYQDKKIAHKNLGPSEFLADNMADGLSVLPEGQDKNSAGTTYGNMNSFLEPFDGPMPGGMLMPAIYSMISILTFSSLVEGIMLGTKSDIINYDKASKIKNAENPETLSLGSSTPKEGNIQQKFLRMFGIKDTDSDWGRCVLKGLELFYGMPGIDDIVRTPGDLNKFNLIVNSAENLIQAPGFYLVMQKQVIRDFEQVTKVAKGFTGSLGVLSGTSQLFRLVESITSSTTFKFIMICAAIGDQALKSVYNPGGNAHDGALVYTKEQQEGKILKPENRGSLSRYIPPEYANTNPKQFRSPLSLSSFHALLNNKGVAGLIPNHLRVSEDKFDEGKFLNVKSPENGIRFSNEDVDTIENLINSEYVPFSFQDLRTNEIISLPSFIENVSDNFAIKYDEKESYGRIDPVMSYVSTKRSISLSFFLVAMNEEDHHYLWFVVNKIVSMCYPQRSRGKIRQGKLGEKGKVIFTQPFSQVPTSSPMVRVRLGDVIKSNYSSEKMRQMFGEGDTLTFRKKGDDFQENELIINSKEQNTIFENNRKISNIRKDAIKLLLREKETAFRTKNFNGKIVLPAGTFVSFTNPSFTQGDYFKTLKFKTLKSVEVQVTTDFNTYSFSLTNISTLEEAEKFGGMKLRNFLVNSAINLLPTIPLKFYFTPDNVFPTFKLLELEIQGKIETDERYTEINQQLNDLSLLNDFFDSKNNAVVKSFETVSGKGLAGFITSLDVDYNNKLWGASRTGPQKDNNLRAPLSVNMKIQFTPIHDLPIGMDYTGDMLSPVYPVGKYFNFETDMTPKSEKK